MPRNTEAGNIITTRHAQCLNHFLLPLSAPHIQPRKEKDAEPVEPFTHPADGDGQGIFFQHYIYIDAVENDGDEFDKECDAAVAGAGNGIHPHNGE